jgi:hypothetical protein
MMRDQVSMEAVAKRLPVVLPAPLGQPQSDIQGHCHAATASSTCIRALVANKKVNYLDSVVSPCSSACLHSLLLG